MNPREQPLLIDGHWEELVLQLWRILCRGRLHALRLGHGPPVVNLLVIAIIDPVALDPILPEHPVPLDSASKGSQGLGSQMPAMKPASQVFVSRFCLSLSSVLLEGAEGLLSQLLKVVFEIEGRIFVVMFTNR